MFTWISDLLSGGQSQADAQANLDAEKKTYLLQLNDRLTAGQITPAYYQGEVFKLQTEFNLEDPTGAVWQAFSDQFVIDVTQLPQNIATGVQAGATWVGTTVGGAVGGVVGGVVGGTSKALWKNIPLAVWLLLAVGVGFFVWAVWKGKIKAIPLPV